MKVEQVSRKSRATQLIQPVNQVKCKEWQDTTPDRRQSKTRLTIDDRGSKIARNGVFDCHLSPVGRQMTIENSVSNDFASTFVDSINVFDCSLSSVDTITIARPSMCVFSIVEYDQI